MEEMGSGGHGKIRGAALQLRSNELAGIAVLLIVNFPVFRQNVRMAGWRIPLQEVIMLTFPDTTPA